MRFWYSIVNKAEEDSAEITIYDAIGATWDGDGVTAKQFISDLKAITAKNITLFINSPGGSVFDGLAIYNALAGHGAQITAKIMGIAASAASFIAMAAHKIIMPKNSFMMIHNASGFAWGNAAEMRDTAELLEKIDNSITSIYSSRTGKSADEVKKLMSKDTYMTADEALEFGFADEVTEHVVATAKFELDTLPEVVQQAFKNAQQPPVNAPAASQDDNPLADKVRASFDAAGLGDYSAFFALKIDAAEAIAPAVAKTREIIALCAAARMPDKAGEFITSDKQISEIRAGLLKALADEDERNPINTAAKSGNTNPTNSGASAVKPAEIWSARRRKTL